jgi:GPH family glycoside/pentoside/hexuronide:cation symporter
VYPAMLVLAPAMFADVCDDDELRHGMRREGVLGALYSWMQKTGCAVAFLGSGVALALTGFHVELGGAQRPGAILALRLILAVSTVVWGALALALLARYPLGRERMRDIRADLETRRGVI